MTKDDWLLVKQQLSHPWGSARLMVDGYELSLRVEQTKALKFEILPYVNGKFQGAWLNPGSEEGKRFLRPVKVAVYKRTEKAKITKGLSKTMIKKVFGDTLDKTFTIHQWGWPTFAPLQRHLIANNKVIELVKQEA